jgi:hypothetical protein
MVASSLFSFRKNLPYHIPPDGLTDLERETIFDYCRYLHAEMELPRRGYLPQCSEDLVSPLSSAVFPLEDSGDLDSSDPIYDLVDRCYTGYVSIPYLGGERFKPEEELREGMSFKSIATRPIRFLEKLGYLYHERKTTIIIGEEGKDVLRRLFDTPVSREYEYFVLEDVSEAQLISLGMMKSQIFGDEVTWASQKRKYYDWDRPEREDWKRLRYDPDDSGSDDSTDSELHRQDRDILPLRRAVRHFRDLQD